MKSTVAPYQTAAWCVRIECTNGTIVRLTSYPTDLTMSNAEVYKTDSGYQQTAFTSSSSFSPSSIDIEGVVAVGGVSREALVSGVFDNARAYIFKCNFLSPVEDYEPVSCGLFGKTTLEDDKYTIQGLNLIDVLSQSVGKTYTALCSHTFGDARCGISLAAITVTGTLTHVTNSAYVRDSARGEAANTFTGGTIAFTTGANVGLKPLEVKEHTANGELTTFEGFYYTPAVGDAYVLVPGCRKRLVDCQGFDNVINRFAFDHIPTGSDYSQVGGA